MAKNGGKRQGAGRPKGSTNKPRILDYWTPEEIQEYFDHLKEKYKKDPRLTVFVGEQLMGKASQPVEHSGDITTHIDDEHKAKATAAIQEVVGGANS